MTIAATIATIPEREDAFTAAVESLLPQVDYVYVYLNGHAAPPEVCRAPGVLWSGTCAGGEDLGDAGKFAYAEHMKDRYVLTCDDDLVYPPDYARQMVQGVERYGRRAVVTLHGKRFDARPVASYCRGYSASYRCLDSVEADAPVHVPGTGCMAYHTSTIRFRLSDFLRPNMADIWAAKVCAEEGVPVVCLAHEAGWLRHQDIDLSSTIWARTVGRDEYQTEIINQIPFAA